MAFTVAQMVAHAELHYDTARRVLEVAHTEASDRGEGWDGLVVAEAAAGLLAVELARYREGLT